MRVLVVDDDVVVHMSMTMTWDDVEVIECTRAAEAFRVGVTERPDSFVVDLRLPDGDGLDLVRRLRCDLRTNQTPIAVLTAAYEPADELGVLKSGGDAYLAKPFEPTQLLRVLQQLLALSGTERRARRQRSMKLLRGGVAPEPVIDLTDTDVVMSWRDQALRSGQQPNALYGKRFWQRQARAVSR